MEILAALTAFALGGALAVLVHVVRQRWPR